MIEAFKNLLALPDLRMRLGITLLALFGYRLGCHVPVPSVNVRALQEFLNAQGGGVFGLVDLFSGGALSKFSVFALGIMPYISMSIIMQLMTTVVPQLEALNKEGEMGRRKINQWTRYLTVILCIIQASATTTFLRNLPPSAQFGPILPEWNMGVAALLVLTLTTGTCLLMWMGEQVTEHGIGNGISLLIFAGIVSRIPFEIGSTMKMVQVGEVGWVTLGIFIVMMVSMTGLAVVTQQAHRKIPVQYPQRTRAGFPAMGGVSTSLPLKVDYSGVIAVIFASSLLMLPTMMLRMTVKESEDSAVQRLLRALLDGFAPGTAMYTLAYGALVVFFCYFYTAVIFNPVDVAENMKKFGGFVPGIRPGPSTAEHIDHVLTRITLLGAAGVVIIAIVPEQMATAMRIPFYFGGTTLLITVGVALDTLKQLESHLLMHHYEGFMKKAKLQGRMPY
ncbi:MAG: preprotein translocase subunit SecY [Candidatus Coatesbacteria bacterium]